MKFQLLLAMTVYVFSLFALALSVFTMRKRSIQSGAVSPKYFKTYEGTPPPERVVQVAQNYDNQFQVPMLFLITGALFVAMDAVTGLTVGLAWAFVASRYFHAWVHIGHNKLIPRVAGFALGWLCVVLLWVQLLAFAAGAR